ncbi:unnamed protein product [Urochloa humidicola]
MSRRTRQPAAGGSRRTRRAELPPPQPPAEAALAEGPKIVSNPIFGCEEAAPSQQPKPTAGGDQLRCVYRPNSLYALVHDPAATAAANGGTGKPLPLPPCRAHRAGQGAAGSHVPPSRSGPAALVAGGPHGRVLRRAAPRDPFLAAYVACSKSNAGGGGGEDAAAGVDRQQQKQMKGKKKRRNAAKKKRGKEGEEVAVRGCGAIWSGGWVAAGAKYAGAMSCRHGCAVADQQKEDAAPAAAAKKEAGEDAMAVTVPTLDLSWAPAVLSARTTERRRQQR